MFPKFHGITLAKDAYIENMRVERLAADPATPGHGRIWYNTTEKALKYTSLNSSGGVVVQAFGDAGSIADLDSRLGSIEGDLVTTEYVDTKIAELGSVFDYVGEVTPGPTAGNAFDMATLTDKAAGAYYKAAGAGYVVVGNGSASYVNKGDGLLFNGAGDVDHVDNTNSEIDGTADFVEVTGSADTGFTVDLAASFKGRVTTLETGLADEVQARQDADTALSGRLDSAETAATNLEGRVSDNETAITGLEGRMTTTEELPGKINGQRFTYQSAAAAIEHVIDHNLNSLFVSAVVWTEGSDGIYRQDIVEVEETSANRLTVRLTESAKIKAVIGVMESV